MTRFHFNKRFLLLLVSMAHQASAGTYLPKGYAAAESPFWTYEKQVDKAGRTVYKALNRSPTQLQLGFPFVGNTTATLTIRKRVSSDTHLYIQLENGQFNRSFQGGTARIRFNGSSPKSYAFSAAENGSANIIFFDDTQALLQRIKSAPTMTIEVEFAGKGSRQLLFRTAGLRWRY